MAFVVVYDANDLHPNLLRDVLIRVASAARRDFPDVELSTWNFEAKHPEDYLVDQLHIDALALHGIVRQIAADSARPSQSF